jgi:hypothetical protein
MLMSEQFGFGLRGPIDVSALFLCSFKMKAVFNYLTDHRKLIEQGENILIKLWN